MSEFKFSQEKWNFILDLKDQNKRQQDEIDRLRRVTRALNSKVEEMSETITKLRKDVSLHNLFGPKPSKYLIVNDPAYQGPIHVNWDYIKRVSCEFNPNEIFIYMKTGHVYRHIVKEGESDSISHYQGAIED